MLKQLFLPVSLLLTVILSVADLNGRWLGTVKTANGDDIEVTYNFVADGEKLTGAVITQWGEHPIVDGKITGDAFSFTQKFNEMQISHSGKIAGDSLFVKIERAEAPVMEAIFRRSPNK